MTWCSLGLVYDVRGSDHFSDGSLSGGVLRYVSATSVC